MKEELDFRAMTVNERLYVSGLLGDFDQAVRSKNVERVIRILKDVQLTDGNIKQILEKYGLLNE